MDIVREMDNAIKQIKIDSSKPLINTETPQYYSKFSMVKGFFQQDEARGRDSSKLGTVYNFPPNFGLKPQYGKRSDWQEFERKLAKMNEEGRKDNTEFVLVYLARHGQSYHNIGEEKVGKYIWENPSSISEIPLCHLPQFQDARLTPAGIDQTITLSKTIQSLHQNSDLPLPQSHYTSPLHRACTTTALTWTPLYSSNTPTPNSTINNDSHLQSNSNNTTITTHSPPSFNPIIHEPLREQLYPHNCNQRNSLTTIRTSFPTFKFFHQLVNYHQTTTSNPILVPTETDTQWTPHTIEPNKTVTRRARQALTDILTQNFNTQNQNQIISITSHAGFMSGIYRVLGYKQAEIPRFPTGIMVPVLIRVERMVVDGCDEQDNDGEEEDEEEEKEVNGLMVGNVDSDAGRERDLGGRDLNVILDEVFGEEYYEEVKRGIKDGTWT